ncbi:MAG TPA: ABC transporter substrate-binding protein [Casimicrobiaceae bacterium]|jgi:NitT/TauT family transport system substrate-binding protein|nr:ABC transporter substrate-binding protein [Casimicrobiaceae bacterium]
MPVINRFVLALFLAVTGMPAYAELAEINVAQQYGVSFLPLMVMERDKLVEKHAKAAGLSDVKVNWVKVAGPSVMNDGVISGAIQFIAVGAPSLITLWDKTQSNVQVKGLSAMTTYPLYLNVRNPSVKSIRDFSDKDKIAVPSIKVSTQAIMLQMAAAKEFGDANYARLDPWTVGLSHPDGLLAITNNSGGVDAHFTTSPFHEQEMKIPGMRTLTTSYEILGGPATALVLATSTKYRDANPKSYKAFYDALKEAIDSINKDKRAAAKVYLEQAKDTKSTVDDIYGMISAADYAYTLTPQKVGKTADFMYKIGAIKTKPGSWKDFFFPEVQSLPGD